MQRYGIFCIGGRTPIPVKITHKYASGVRAVAGIRPKKARYWLRVKSCCDMTSGLCTFPSSEWMHIKMNLPTKSENKVLKFEVKQEKNGDLDYDRV